MKKIQLGIIGCGKHAEDGHLRPALLNGRFELAAVHDPQPERMQALIKAAHPDWPAVAFHEPAVTTCDSLAQLLALESVDAVIITSFDAFHAQQLLMAVKAGKHVLVDKPYALNEDDAVMVREALAIAAERERPLVVTGCHPRRYEDEKHPYGWIQRNLPHLVRDFGRLVYIGQDFSYHIPTADWKHNRSLLGDHAPHELDTLRWLVPNAPLYVRATYDRDDSYSMFGIIGDVVFSCVGTRMLEDSVFPETVTLRFARGTCVVETREGMVTQTRHGRRWRLEFGIDGIKTPDDYDHRSLRGMQNFADAIERGTAPYVTPDDLLLNTEAVLALMSESGEFRSN